MYIYACVCVCVCVSVSEREKFNVLSLITTSSFAPHHWHTNQVQFLTKDQRG